MLFHQLIKHAVRGKWVKNMNPAQDKKKPGSGQGQDDAAAAAAKSKLKEKPTGARLDPVTVALKRIHDSVVDEPLPDDFLTLLNEIDAKIAAEEGQG